MALLCLSFKVHPCSNRGGAFLTFSFTADASLVEKHARELCDLITPTLRIYHLRAATRAIEKLLAIAVRSSDFLRLFLTRLVRISDRYAQFPTQYAAEGVQIWRWLQIVLRHAPNAKESDVLSPLLQSQGPIASLIVQRRPTHAVEILSGLKPILQKDSALFAAYAEALLSSVSANNIALVAASSAALKPNDPLKVGSLDLMCLDLALALALSFRSSHTGPRLASWKHMQRTSSHRALLFPLC